LVGTNGRVRGTGQSRVDGQVQGGDGVAASGTVEVGSVGASGVDGLPVPGIRQLVGTDGCISGTGQGRVDSQVESGNGITPSSTGEIGSIGSGSIDGLSVPGVGQLDGAYGYIGRTGQCWRYSQVEGSNGVTSGSTGQVSCICSSSIDGLSVPGIG